MDIFFILGALAIAATLFIIHGLASPTPQSDQQLNVSFFNARLATLRQNVADGLISEKDAHGSEAFLARSLIQAQKTLEETPDAKNQNALRSMRAFVVILWLTMPLSTLGAYAFLGQPNEITRMQKPKQLVPNAAFSRAEARLKLDPNHQESLKKVLPFYMRAGRFEDAIEKLETLLRIEKPTAKKYAELAQAHVLAQNGFVPPEAEDALKKALRLEPTNVAARFLLAVADQQNGHRDSAVKTLQALARESKNEEKKQFFMRYAARISQNSPQTQAPPPAVLQMVRRLETRLLTQGGSFPEWEKLLRSYRVLGEDDKLRKTLEEIAVRYANDERSETKAWLAKILEKFSPKEKKKK